MSFLGQRLGLLFVCVCAGAQRSSVTKLPGNPTVHESRISQVWFSVENKWTKPSYLPPENVLWCGVAWGDVGVPPGLAVTVGFGRSLERGGISDGSTGGLCLVHGLS